jgi:hypothetical protein
MTTLPRKVVNLHRALADHRIPHAFGGALALAWYTGQARGTVDIDLNVFVAANDAARVLEALPSGVRSSHEHERLLVRDGQARLRWGDTPIDLFLNTTEFHEAVALRAVTRTFMKEDLPFLSCEDLIVFKAFFNRTKDWADLEAIAAAGNLDAGPAIANLSTFLGADDERLERLRKLM